MAEAPNDEENNGHAQAALEEMFERLLSCHNQPQEMFQSLLSLLPVPPPNVENPPPNVENGQAGMVEMFGRPISGHDLPGQGIFQSIQSMLTVPPSNDEEDNGHAQAALEKMLESLMSYHDQPSKIFQSIQSLLPALSPDHDYLDTATELGLGALSLFINTFSNNTQYVKSLVSQGVDVNCRLASFTALHWSVMLNNTNMVECLISLGADVNVRNDLGLNCLDMARLLNNMDIVEYLENLHIANNGDSEFPASETPVNDEILDTLANTGVIGIIKALITPLMSQLTTAVGGSDQDNSIQQSNFIQLSLLMTVIMVDDMDTAAKLVSQGVNVNGIFQGKTLLQLVSTSGKLAMVKGLIRLGADINARDNDQLNCIHYASLSNNPELVKHLASLGVDVNCKGMNDETPLMLAVARGNMDMTKCLVDLGADINAIDENQATCLHRASLSNNLDLVEYLVSQCLDVNCKDVDGVTPLLLATAEGNIDMVRCLIGLNADVNAREKSGRNCLHLAAESNNPDLVEFLASEGADVNCKDENDITPLLITTRNGNMGVTKTLIDLGADVNASDNNQKNCLHYASQSTNPDLVKYLVEQKRVDINSKDRFDNTPLLISATNGDMHVTNCLINLGADVNARNARQMNCLHLASVSKNPDLVEYLARQGADVNCKTIKGWSPLFVSLIYKDEETVSVLIRLMKERAVTPSTSELDLGSSAAISDPLVLCAKLGYLFGARSILDAGVNINTPWKHSCLYLSCLYGHIDIVRLLLLTEEYDLLDGSGKDIFRKSPFSNVIDYPSILLDGISSLHQPQSTSRLEALICTPGVGSVLKLPNTYASKVCEAVMELLKPVPKSMSGLYSDAERSICGSVGEDAKVGLPNEMDILFPVKCGEKYRYIKETQICSGYVQFSAPGDFSQGSILFHETFYDEWYKAFNSDNCPNNSTVSRMPMGSEVGSIKKMNRKACTPLLLIYTAEATTLYVSVDIVPCVHINNWSNEFISKTWLMDRCQLKEWGYILVPKPPHRKSKIAHKFTEKQMEQLWRVSFSDLEVKHIRSLEDRIRNVYVAAKCLRNPDVCRIMITEGEGLPNNVDDYISSYMLKSMFFKNIEDFLRHPQSLEEMVCKVYDDLDEALQEGFIPTFFMPRVNVLDGLKTDVEKCSKVASVMKTYVRRFRGGEGSFHHGDKTEDASGTYSVYNIMNDQWTTFTLKLKRPLPNSEITVYKRTWQYK